jgi:hypothetical protein
MIHHISIPARDTARVARVLSELTTSRIYRFPGPLPGALMVVGSDAHGTMIEVYPDTVEMHPGEGEESVRFAAATGERPHGAFHALVSTTLDRARIEAIAAREGWRAKTFGRGLPGEPPLFHVVEVWLENRILIELATERMLAAYLEAFRHHALEGLGLNLDSERSDEQSHRSILAHTIGP